MLTAYRGNGMPEDLKNFADDDADLNAEIITGLAVLGACVAGLFLAVTIGATLWLLGYA